MSSLLELCSLVLVLLFSLLNGSSGQLFGLTGGGGAAGGLSGGGGGAGKIGLIGGGGLVGANNQVLGDVDEAGVTPLGNKAAQLTGAGGTNANVQAQGAAGGQAQGAAGAQAQGAAGALAQGAAGAQVQGAAGAQAQGAAGALAQGAAGAQVQGAAGAQAQGAAGGQAQAQTGAQAQGAAGAAGTAQGAAGAAGAAGTAQGAVGAAGAAKAPGGGQFMESKAMGTWEIFSKDSGVSAMHMQLFPNNKIAMYDAASLGPSNIQLPPNNCRFIPPNVTDCFAHGVLFDTETGKVRVLKVLSDLWCSSGGLREDGQLISTGGWADGEKGLRFLDSCDTCDFRENPAKLSDIRWYGTQAQLGDGRYVEFGGRRAFNYEFVPAEGQPSKGKIDLPFLKDTTDLYENNLYPFVALSPSNTLFLFANNRAILLDPVKNQIVRNYPPLPGGARNYPGSGCSTILPMRLTPGQTTYDDIEVIVCGGALPEAFGKADKETIFLPALDTCGRMKFMQPNAQWDMEKMPSPRVMGDMLILPNGHLITLNGAQKGASGWQFAEEPNFTPVLYRPDNPKGQRFRNLAPTNIARMYHSTAALLRSGKILVAGSNTNPKYEYNVKYPTELRVEKYSPPYLDPAFNQYRPKISPQAPKTAAYGQNINVPFGLTQPAVQKDDVMVVLYKPPFTTHGYSMNQRLLDLAIMSVAPGGVGQWSAVAQAPMKGELAPPGYYIMFVNYRGVPGDGVWIQLK